MTHVKETDIVTIMTDWTRRIVKESGRALTQELRKNIHVMFCTLRDFLNSYKCVFVYNSAVIPSPNLGVNLGVSWNRPQNISRKSLMLIYPRKIGSLISITTN